MLKKILLLVILTALLKPVLSAGIPMKDILALAQRVYTWTLENEQWIKYFSQLDKSRDLMQAFYTSNRMFNLGLQDGLNAVASIRTDLRRLKLYYGQISDFPGNIWRDIYLSGQSIRFQYPRIRIGNFQQTAQKNILYQNNPHIKKNVDKLIKKQESVIERIDQLVELIRDLNEVEKAATNSIEELQKALDKSSRGDPEKGQAAAVSGIIYNLVVVRLTTMRTRLIGIMTIRTINEFRMKRDVEALEWMIHQEKEASIEPENIQLLNLE